MVAMMMMMMMMMTEAAAMPKGSGSSKHLAKHPGHRKSSDGAAVETVPLQLDPNALVPTKNLRPLENSSISPWTYNISHDESLFPPMLSEARCLLNGCLDSEGREDLNLESRPIMHQVLLLRRVRSVGSGVGNSYHYRLESRLIAVGCTCVRPIVQQQQ
ncbi:interleukin 17a/f1 [Morone saxatilis]|uniref:interleukin 17a/f1 n=1 Tax=Morone saxatilis TaxID=34816 RepID=UPI0015E21D24|nr:interleukin 17a/f1 [Morone saxatilis]